MKTKTIKSVIRNKINYWLKSITDDQLRKDVEGNVIVTGGAIVSMLLDEEVNDYDIYFSNKKIAEKIARYYVGKLGEEREPVSVGFPEEWGGDEELYQERVYLNIPNGTYKVKKKWPQRSKYNPVFFSNNAITLEGDVQLIFRFTGSPDTIHRNFDFVHCMGYWHNGKLELSKETLESLLTKELIYVGSKYPICSMIRTRKYINRGFTINAGEYLKIAWQISKLDLGNIKVLREQLVGVDIYYFEYLLREIQKRKTSSEHGITEGWLFEQIDKIFSK